MKHVPSKLKKGLSQKKKGLKKGLSQKKVKKRKIQLQKSSFSKH